MKLNNIVLILMLFLEACSLQDDKNVLARSNCIVTKDKLTTLTAGYNNYTKDNEQGAFVKFSVQFFNNPYNLDSSFQLTLVITNGIVYSGDFSRNFSILIPKSYIDKRNEIKFILTKNGVCYVFGTEQSSLIENNDNFLQLVFIPKENDWFTFFYSFTNDLKYQEMP